MRICLLSYRASPFSGGQGIYIRNLSRSLLKLGHEVDVIAGPYYPDLVEGVNLIKLPSLELYELPEYRRYFINPLKLTNLPNLVEWLGECRGIFTEPVSFGMRAYNMFRQDGYMRRYDVIHDNQCLANGIYQINRMGMPAVVTIHHPMTIDRELALKAATSRRKYMEIKAWYSFIEDQIKVAQKFSHIITDSQNSLREIIEDYKIPADKFRIIYCGVDHEVFKEKTSVNRLRNRLLVVNSGDTPLKGLKYLFEAVNVIRKQREVELYIVGKPMKKDGYTEGLIRELHLEDFIKYTGKISTDDLVDYYSTSTMLVVPSIHEGFGLPAAEAMACGAPVISTTAGALPEVVGEAGILIPPADVNSIVQSVTALLDDSARCRELGARGKERALRLFNWDTAAKQTADYYSEAIRFQNSTGRRGK